MDIDLFADIDLDALLSSFYGEPAGISDLIVPSPPPPMPAHDAEAEFLESVTSRASPPGEEALTEIERFLMQEGEGELGRRTGASAWRSSSTRCEVEPQQVAAGLDAEGVGHAHAPAAGAAVGQPDLRLGLGVTLHQHHQQEELQRRRKQHHPPPPPPRIAAAEHGLQYDDPSRQ
ncbi:bZIP transcription factor 60-like [Panicum miliaceum]|uniref:BZIP transcription factor 60-like n=1 Tax=Panicum miliaceum TaxID=4540 RepID=A0A3L6R7T4_PANMI|nr:bZIP transcription factor 60-like [Panicum miliaceum]